MGVPGWAIITCTIVPSQGVEGFMSKAKRPPTFTLVPAGMQQQVGPDGQPYIVPLFHLRDKDGNIAALNTPKGAIPFTLVGAPINVAQVPGLVLPPSTPVRLAR